ncbi:DUF59 domain-containing protein [candidate division KSB1 bacterium]|nr:DUF59 domain-containing protein [candidate division KSB1 bacterium]
MKHNLNETLEQRLDTVVDILRDIYDPEIPVNIYDLGLIYELNITETGLVEIEMTLTSPACPVAESLPREVERRLRKAQAITEVRVNVVWDPPWDQSLMSDEAKLELGLL